MRIPKRYGQSKIETCPFCDRTATAQNKQGLPVCEKHKDSNLENLKCVCGEYLDMKIGKWGPYFTCMNCGNINYKKARGMNPDAGKNSETTYKAQKKQVKAPKPEKTAITVIERKKHYELKTKETTVRSDELDLI